MRTMKLSDIKIPEAFVNNIPRENKMNECRNNWNTYHIQDRYIVVNNDNVLIDGYIMYLVLVENKEEFAEVKIASHKKKRWHRKSEKDLIIPTYKENRTTYIFGIHPNSNCTKEFVWRVPVNWGNWADNIQVGDTILCQTKFGFSPVVVNRVETLDKPPIEIRIKKVTRKEIRRDGLVVESCV